MPPGPSREPLIRPRVREVSQVYIEVERTLERNPMSHKLKIAGWISVGALAGALTTVSLQTVARGSLAPLPLEELQQLAAVFGMVKTDYVEAVDEKKLISDAISGMVAGLDPHSQHFDKKSFKEFRESTGGKSVGIGIEMGMEEGLVK